MLNDFLHFVAQIVQTWICVPGSRNTVCSREQLLVLLLHLMHSSPSSGYPVYLISSICTRKQGLCYCIYANFSSVIVWCVKYFNKWRGLCASHLSQFSSGLPAVAFWHHQSTQQHFQHNCYCWSFCSSCKSHRLLG